MNAAWTGLLAENYRRGGENLLVELFTETADDWFLQELIDTDTLTFSFFKSIRTYIPMMYIQRQHAIRELLDPYGIKRT